MTANHPTRLGRGFGLLAFAVAVVATLAIVSFPIRGHRPSAVLAVLIALLLCSHAALYWGGGRFRARWGAAAYFAAQAVVVFLVGLSPALYPLGVGLYLALGVEAFIVSDGAVKGVPLVPLTLGIIALCVIDAGLALNVYRAASLGMFLTVAVLCVFAFRAVIDRFSHGRERPLASDSSSRDREGGVDTRPSARGPATLTAREQEVLSWLVRGSRTRHIAESLGVTERTVKAHLGSIYQKLGVESRTAAIAAVIERDLLEAHRKELEAKIGTPPGL